jgi:hypothetical protein
MLDKLIEEGRLLHQRIEEHFRSGPDALPPEERISVPRLQRSVACLKRRTFDVHYYRELISGPRESNAIRPK